ncbi:MAG TPA: anhydro-N-acetylmuramic acid kinase, partial [Thermoleophilia bacterium]|nr:anhydro-N-acetylmuramic acid kinase [Thermoleophilia bacterium]
MKVIGLMSGTSADGVDAALLEIGPGRALPRLRLLHYMVFPFPRGLRERILRAADEHPGGA